MSEISGVRWGMASRLGSVGRLGRASAMGLALVAAVACSTTTSPEQRPSEASIQVTGSSTVPLRLIVSTEFIETFDPVDEVREQIFLTADTTIISELPYSGMVTLGATSSIVVDVANLEEEPATVRVFVELDGNQPLFDREAVMSLGGALRYVYTWRAPTL